MRHYQQRESEREREGRALARAAHEAHERDAYERLAAANRQPCGHCHNCHVGIACSYVLA
jgi:hypothetical protein